LIEIVDYRDGWPGEFRALAGRIRTALGEDAIRIDHIGSTAVPGLAAKDVIDLQITVERIEHTIGLRLAGSGFVRRQPISVDHRPPGTAIPDMELQKELFVNADGERRANIHVRVAGRFNQRYPLLCRDYLRAHPLAAAAYAQVKRALAQHLGHDVEAYYDVKDPVFDILMTGAEAWAAATGWSPGGSDA
jgi:GrpB-like predicted nucleotidyltransferase (UPF0157 family)